MQEFFAPTRICWGAPDFASTLEAAVRDLGSTRPGIIVDAALYPAAIVEHALSEVKPVVVEVHAGGEPDTDRADEVTGAFRDAACDAVIGLGGGSTLDLAKAVGGLVNTEGTAAEFQGFDLLRSPTLPVIAVPTTAGTGSEVTGTAVLHNRTKALKLGINSRQIIPTTAILEPRLLLGMPRRLVLSSAMDALSHAVESYTARRATPISRSLSVAAFKQLAATLGHVLDHDDDLDARRAMLLGSTMAGLAVLNAGTGAAHAMAYPIGVRLGVPHSEALTMLLPEITRSCATAAPGIYGELADGDLATMLDKLVERSGIHLRLSDFSDAPDLRLLAAESMNLVSAVDNHPVQFTEQDALSILSAIA